MPRRSQINTVIELGVSNPQHNLNYLQDAITALAQEAARNRLRDTGTFSVSASAVVPTTNANGTITLGSPAYGGEVRPGTYTLTCTATAANGGTFSVVDPEGNTIGSATVGTLFDGEVRFTINDGSNDYATGDVFTLTVTAASEARLVDNSTGVAAATLVSIGTPVLGVVDGVTNFSPKTGFDTAITKIENAHEELSSAMRTVIDIIAGSSYPKPNLIAGATGADLTIAALDKALTAGATSCVPYAGAVAQIANARNNQATLASVLNFIRTAVGLAPVTDNTGGVVSRSQTAWTLTAKATTGTAVSTNGQETVTDASTDAALNALANNIATLAARFNEVLSNLRIGPFVVATQSPRSRNVLGDVTA